MISIQEKANQILQKSMTASAIFNNLDQEHIDRIVGAIAKAAFNNRVRLAKMAYEETGMGNWQDKVTKNVVASQLVYEDIKDLKTVGVISEDKITGITEIAQPIGPILAVTPVTNPTSTVIFKILVSLKGRNPVIISGHRNSLKCCMETVRICYEAALSEDAPEDCIQMITEPSRDMTHALMTHPGLGLILATGGSGLVKAAYSSGVPAIGVGAGNVPVLIDSTADIPFAIENILISKTFDNGTACASEQAIVVEKSIDEKVKAEFIKKGCYFLNKEETANVSAIAVDPETSMMNSEIVGKSASFIAEKANIKIPKDTKVLIAELKGVGNDYPLSLEVLAPILAYYVEKDFDACLKRCIDINHCGGLGHTAAIYSNSESNIAYYSNMMNAGRVVVNTPSTHGAVGGIFNSVTPSLTLGCGSGGKNITTENISARHLINIKRVCRRRDNIRLARFDTKKYLDEKNDMDFILSEYNKNY